LKASAEPAAQGISSSASPLPIASEITVPEQMTVAELAAALNQKPFRIIGDLIQSGIFATLNQVLDSETIMKVSQKYGFIAKRAV
jgi:translation initiation factor IF-2